jgi:hypothetical protein
VRDGSRSGTPSRLVGYLGLDPRVRQSGPGPARHGRISKQGSAPARYALVEAAWSMVRQPGPLRAFYERIRTRRRHQVAIVACARKLACLFWCLLTREEDYAYAQPSLTKKKLRRLELAAGAKRGKVKPGLWAANKAMREQSASSPARGRSPIGERSPTGRRMGRGRAPARHRGAHLVGRQAAKQRGRHQPRNLLFSSSSGPAPGSNSPKLEVLRLERIDFHPSRKGEAKSPPSGTPTPAWRRKRPVS